MATDKRRITVTIPPEIEPELDQLKRDRFYNDHQSVMIQFLIKEGIKSLAGSAKDEKVC